MRQLGQLERQLLANSGLVTAGKLLGMGVRIGAQLILARLIAPDDFGRFGLALLVVLLLTAIVENGLAWPLVYVGEDEAATTTALVLAGTLGLALYAAAWLFAPVMAAAYQQPALDELLRITALGVIVAALGVTPDGVLQRRQRFGRRVLAGLGGVGSGALVSVGLGLAGGGAAALAWGWVAGELVTCLLAWGLAGWWPRARPAWTLARRLLAFGRYTAGSGLLIVAVSNVDDAVVGAVLGVQALGYYGLAYGWANLLSRGLVGPVAGAMFPTYLRAGAEPGQLAGLYLSVVRGSAVIVMPASLLLVLLGREAAPVLLGPTWAPVGPLLQILAGLLLARGLAISQAALFSSLGRPQWRTVIIAVELLVLAVGLVPAARLGGVPAVAGLVAGAATISAGLGLMIAQRALALGSRQLLTLLARPVLAAALASLIVLGAGPLRHSLPPLLSLIVAVVVCLGVYTVTLLLLWPRLRTTDARPRAGAERAGDARP